MASRRTDGAARDHGHQSGLPLELRVEPICTSGAPKCLT
jgi:hypothetical protein